MGRLNDWPERLNDVIEEWRDRPFEWGKADCVGFVLAVDAAMYGKSRLKLPRYTTKTGAARLIKKRGGDLSVAVDKVLDRIEPLQAMRGDVAAVDTPDGPALVIVLSGRLVGMGPDGLVFPSIDAAVAAWRL